MSKSHQREWFADLLESLPSLAFLALWRTGSELEFAGWSGALLAVAVLLGFRARRFRFHPILLGINIHLAVITPLIAVLFRFGAPDVGSILAAHSYNAVLITVFVTGCCLALFSCTGFIGADGLSRTTARFYSVLLLIACASGIVWAFASEGGPFAAVGLPLVGLFALRRLLIAHAIDKGANAIGPVAIASGGALSHDAGNGNQA